MKIKFLDPYGATWERAEWERAWSILLAKEGTRDTSRPWAVTPLVCSCGQEWQYMGTAENPHRDMRLNPELGMSWRHEFRHRCGDGCGLRRYAHVPASAAFSAEANRVLA